MGFFKKITKPIKSATKPIRKVAKPITNPINKGEKLLRNKANKHEIFGSANINYNISTGVSTNVFITN